VALLPLAARAAVTPANVASLVLKWDVATGAQTGGPILRDGRLYAGSWDGNVYALDPATGAEIWKRTVGPVAGRLHVLADGGVCYGTLLGQVGCLDGADGAVRWTTSLAEPLMGTIWSAPVEANGRLFVGVAGLTDDPCTRGRLVALDVATGAELWRFYTIPEKICDTDTSVACSVDADCPDAGTCTVAQGGGVTATPAVDPTGEWVYMNTVGCYRFPSVGESDSIFKIAASTGTVAWRNRVNAPEQFGACDNDTSIDCGVDAHCAAVGGACTKKGTYHDFGFLNGPLLIDVPDDMGGTKPLVVSGSKNGTLYAFDEATGAIVWTNVVRATPITPGFAGFGLFNGALTHAGGRLFAALYFMIPPRVCGNDARKQCSADADCPGGTCPPEPKHLMAFDATTGMTIWEDEIGRSWSHVAVENGVLYAGTQAKDPVTAESWLYAYDAASGTRLATFTLPTSSTARAAVVGDTVYVGYGLGAGSGLRAYSLCPNGMLDAGEQCDGGDATTDCCSDTCTFEPAGLGCGIDDGNPCTGAACDGAGTCVMSNLDAAPCDDGDVCTANDACQTGACSASIATVGELDCSVRQLADSPCGEEPLPRALARTIDRSLDRIQRVLEKGAAASASGKRDKAERLRRRVLAMLETIGRKADRAAASRKAANRISAPCRDAIAALVASRRALVAGFVF
jgi:outer membrane protein assembly factor BamB